MGFFTNVGSSSSWDGGLGWEAGLGSRLRLLRPHLFLFFFSLSSLFPSFCACPPFSSWPTSPPWLLIGYPIFKRNPPPRVSYGRRSASLAVLHLLLSPVCSYGKGTTAAGRPADGQPPEVPPPMMTRPKTGGVIGEHSAGGSEGGTPGGRRAPTQLGERNPQGHRTPGWPSWRHSRTGPVEHGRESLSTSEQETNPRGGAATGTGPVSL